MEKPCFYGLVNPAQVREIVVAVCGVLGLAGGFAVDMLIETAAQETHLGTYRDTTPYGAGRGLFQIDLIAFQDIQARTKPADAKLILDNFGFDIKKVSHNALDSSPLLAAIFCRLFYKLIPEVIPSSVGARAAYWKKYYNTTAGKGSADAYIKNSIIYGSLC